MTISSENIGRLLASGRNYTNLILGFIGGIGLMSAAQQKGLMDALSQIWDGLVQIFNGATSAWQIIAIIAAPIIGPLLARMASNSAKVSSQANALQIAVQDPNTPIAPEVKQTIIATAKAV